MIYYDSNSNIFICFLILIINNVYYDYMYNVIILLLLLYVIFIVKEI